MLLETLDVRYHDILVYSQNQFDFENNFKIIFKNKTFKKPRPISFFDVCDIIKYPVPKNLIVYRLLTNLSRMDAYSTKYGYFLKVDGKLELIYFDPIFAIKDLRHLRFNLDPESFRFKIQQIGLRTDKISDKEVDFTEIYSYNLRAEEAQNQNDKIFADAIFVFDDSYIPDEGEEDEFDLRMKELLKKKVAKEFSDSPDTKLDFDGITEAKSTSEPVLKPRIKDDSSFDGIHDDKVKLLKKAIGISENVGEQENFNQFLEDYRNNNQSAAQEGSKQKEDEMLDLFKFSDAGSSLSSERESVILKLKKE